jgi:phosphoribosylformylglycinamidine cyclo-ligase
MTTYKDSGVDIDKADTTKQEFAKHVNSDDLRVLNKLGAFASLFKADFPDIENPVLVLKTEEPGSKQLLAAQYNRLSEVGIDLINHLINDIIVMGATPLAVLDTIICGKLEKDIVLELVKNMSEACNTQGCSLIGGETSEQPGVIPSGQYILSASGLGVVDENKIIDGSKIQKGDLIIGIASNGLHTNGYSLVRKIVEENSKLAQDDNFIDALLKPHICYYQAVKDLFDHDGLHGLAHITGGGIPDNICRILPSGLMVTINWSSFETPTIFEEIRFHGQIPVDDMRRTFNMGIGMAIITDVKSSVLIINHIEKQNHNAYIIGRIV